MSNIPENRIFPVAIPYWPENGSAIWGSSNLASQAKKEEMKKAVDTKKADGEDMSYWEQIWGWYMPNTQPPRRDNSQGNIIAMWILFSNRFYNMNRL